MIRRAAVVAMLITGCRNVAKTPAASDGSVPAVIGGAAPGQFVDLAPGDTAGVIAMMRQVMRGIDAGLVAMTRRDTSFAAAADSVARHLTVWLQDAVPRKLVVIDSMGQAQNNIETDVWFMGGDVVVMLQVADAFAFDADRIVLWTDEALQPRIDATPDALMAKQGVLIETVRGWLQRFKIALP